MSVRNCIVAQSGGPTAAINASLAGVIKGVSESGMYDTVYGSLNGITGILNQNLMNLSELMDGHPEYLDRLKVTPAMYLGSCRYKLPHYLDDDSSYVFLFKQFEQYHVEAFFYIGGNDSMDTVLKLSEYAKRIGSSVRIIGIPKTIDNDIWGTDVTFGFDSAVKVATETMDNIKTTASSHGRIFVVEVMGHKTGWVTLYSGIATGADIILIPEIPYDIKKITSYIEKSDKKYLVIAAAEGIVEKEFSSLKNKERRQLLSEKNLKSQVEKLALDIRTATDKEVRITIPGHTQRGGSPTARDRIVSMQTGTATALNIINKNYGVMAAVINGKIVKVPLKEVAGKLKVVPADAEIILQAKEMGICFGD